MRRNLYPVTAARLDDIHADMTGPYSLVAVMTAGHEITIARGHCPRSVRTAHNRVSRNPAAVSRIELRDLTGTLETVWAKTWT